MGRPLYIFDLDGTLIGADSNDMFTRYLMAEGVVDDPAFLPQKDELLRQYMAGVMDVRDYVRFSMSYLRHLTVAEVTDLVRAFVRTMVLPTFYPEARTLVAELKAQGLPCLVISATAAYIVREIAAAIGIDEVIATEIVVKDDHFTTEVDGIPSMGEGKIARLEQYLQDHPELKRPFTFYTDSINDLPLCLYADRVFLVNPDPKLRQQGAEHGWPVLAWQTKP